MPKIVILDGFTTNPGDLSWEKIEALGDCRIYARTSPEETVTRIGDAEAVLTNKVLITREVLDACPKLRYVGVLATGYNVVDLAAASEKGVVVTNVPAYSTMSAAQNAIALLLEIANRVGLHDRAVHEGRWSNCPDFCFWDAPLMELSGKTIGILGFGRIGKAIGTIARALGMRVLACSPHPSDEGRKIAEYVSLDALLAESDVVSLNCPLTGQTREVINHESIQKMKDGAILINNGRGPLINEADVAEALNAGKLRAAGVDVACVEPIPKSSPLLHAKNCVITPHISWATPESRARLMEIAYENLKAYFDGAPIHKVN